MKNTFAALLILTLAAFCLAQNNGKNTGDKNTPNLNGTWVLDKSKSDMGLDKGPIKFTWKVKPEFPDSTLVIVQTASEIRVTENGAAESSIYYTDGKTSVVIGNADKDNKPKAKWKDRKLIIETSIPVSGMSIGGRPARMKKKESWELKKDGDTLIQTTTWEPEFGQGPAPMIKTYVRKS